MNVDRQFRDLVFAQVLLGVVAFCIAERNVGLMLIAGSLVVLSRYVTEGPPNWYMPRSLLNLLALGAVAWLLLEMSWRREHVIVAMGHFTMWLQVLQLYAPRTNRDYGQILVLSLMLMIGASILSVSMVYGLLLAVYCVLGLWTVLWFQLKSTSDQVTAAARRAGDVGDDGETPPVAEPGNPVVGGRYRWHLRGMALLIGAVCAAISAAVFVILPRAPDTQLGRRLAAAVRAEAGFSDHVNLKTRADGRADKDPVLNMRVTLNGEPIGGDEVAFLLRGAALDRYDSRTHLWQRFGPEQTTVRYSLNPDGRTLATPDREDAPLYQAQITHRDPSQRQVFTVHPVTHIASDTISAIFFSPVDQQITAEDAGGAMSYTITWPVNSSVQYVEPYRPFTPFRRRFRRFEFSLDRYARYWYVEREQIAELAMRALEARGLSRDPDAEYTPDDRRIVETLADYLRRNYRYSLTYPDAGRQRDPLIEFLFNHKTGHCELFAAGLAAMCRSINIPARVITGYRVSEYNRVGGYYVVRRDDAHAWCEVDLGPGIGWRTVDPTPPEQVAAEHRGSAGWIRSLRDLYDYFEFRWLRGIVSYNPETRAEVLQSLRQSTSSTFLSPDTWIGRAVLFLRDLPQVWRVDRLNYTLAGFILIVIGVALISLVRTLVIRRNRLAALQLTCLPRAQRRGLSRKLRFYLQMFELLERHGHYRPTWQSPRHFAENLVGRNPVTYEPVLALTECFYEVRFGHREPDEPQIRHHMRRLEHALSQRG